MQFKEKMYKNLVAHKKDKDLYQRHLSTFMNAFPNFLYRNLNSSEPSSLEHEVEETKCSGITHEQ